MNYPVFPRDIWREILSYLHPIEQIRSRLICKFIAQLTEPAATYANWQPCIDFVKLDYKSGVYYKLNNLLCEIKVAYSDVYYYDITINKQVTYHSINDNIPQFPVNAKFMYEFVIGGHVPNLTYKTYRGENATSFSKVFVPAKIISLLNFHQAAGIVRDIYREHFNFDDPKCKYDRYFLKKMVDEHQIGNYLLYYVYIYLQNHPELANNNKIIEPEEYNIIVNNQRVFKHELQNNKIILDLCKSDLQLENGYDLFSDEVPE